MKILNLETNQIFRPKPDGEYTFSFVPSPTGNYIIYMMHWFIPPNGRPTVLPCLRTDCPVCYYGRTLDSESDRKTLQPKARIIANIWEGNDKPVKVLDLNAWLLSRAMIITNDPKFFDPSKYGYIVEFETRKTKNSFIEYFGYPSARREPLPDIVLMQAYDLPSLVIRPTLTELEDELEILLEDKIAEQRIAAIVENIVIDKKEQKASTTNDGMNLIRTVTGRTSSSKANFQELLKKKKKYQEPEPYKRAKRVIVLDDD